MSPEQCKGEPLDRRTDIFALGIVLYELLTQRRLFKRPSPAGTIKAILSDPIVPPSRMVPACPPSLERVCLRALERDPAKRYPTALDMRRDLVAAMATIASGTNDKLPDEQLAALLQTILADRRELKEEMLRCVREGTNPGTLPSPEADESVEIDIPVAASSEQTNTNVSSAVAIPRGQRWPLALVLLAAGVIGGAVVWSNAVRSNRTVVANVPTSPTTTASAIIDATVKVSVDSDPPGAAVIVDGAPMGTTPTTLTLPRATDKRALVLRKDGFVEDHEDLAVDVEQKLRFSLKPVVKPSRTSPGVRKAADAPPPKW